MKGGLVYRFQTHLIGAFQGANLGMALLTCEKFGFQFDELVRLCNSLKPVPGRLEFVGKTKKGGLVYIDFAHTPDALKKTLKALRDLYGDNISIVFGCGGDRDFKKRPMMAKIVNSHCKQIYITDDNPRNENPHRIRQTILKYIKDRDCFNIGNRSKAIHSAIINAEPNDVILIAGKGHESEQIYKNRVIKISDKQIIKRLNNKIKKISLSQQNYLQNQKILNEIQSNFKAQNFDGISIDTRMLKKDNLFLTIKGKNNNGAKFVTKALKKGAKYIVSSQNIKKQKNKIIKVKNEIEFLNKYASKKREKTRAKIIAVTGSAGKTSLKNLIKDLLNNFGKTLSSPKSYNNHFGVPLSLSQLKIEHKFGVFDVGMSKKGEIYKLTKLIRPHFGIITNIGEAHIENFKNLRGIADAKGEIIQNIEKGGTIILNRDDEHFTYLEKKAKKNNLKIVTFGINKKSNVQLVSKSKKRDQELLTIKIKEKILKVKIKNINFYNVLSSLALLDELNLNQNNIINNFKNYEPSEGRGKIHNIKRYKKNFKLIDESYNANPISVKNAIQKLGSIKKQKFKKYLLLGDMLELGQKSEILHKKLSKVINNSDIDKVFIKGNKTLTTYRNINKEKRGNIFQEEEDVDFTLNNIIANNDYLMIKGSNATNLNNLSKRMIKGI